MVFTTLSLISNRIFLVWFGGLSGEFSQNMVRKARRSLAASTTVEVSNGNNKQLKQACYAAKGCQKDTIRYLPHLAKTHGHIRSVDVFHSKSEQETGFLIGQLESGYINMDKRDNQVKKQHFWQIKFAGIT